MKKSQIITDMIEQEDGRGGHTYSSRLIRHRQSIEEIDAELAAEAGIKDEQKQKIRDFVQQWYDARKEAQTKAQFEEELEAYIAGREQAAYLKGVEDGR